jgi:poly(3-hydroxybutyrate) depolymerase
MDGNESAHDDITLHSGISRLDGRFSYRAYRPTAVLANKAPLMLVAIHGSDYLHESMCRYFAPLADEMQCVVLAPLFAPLSGGSPDPNGYKFLRSSYAAYDRILLDMIEDAAARFGAAAQRVFLFGFSGGAQFAHRMFYAYPERLHALGIAAPGMVTLIDPTRDAWVGTQGLDQHVGRGVDVNQLRVIPVQLLVGADDATPHFGEAGAAAYNLAGLNRVERLRTLAANYRAHGIRTTYREIPGVAHTFEPLAAAAVPFLRDEMRRARATAADTAR